MKISRTIYIISTAIGYAYLRLFKDSHQSTELLFERFSELSGVYVKFLQLLIIREDFHDNKYSNLRDSLAVFDRVEVEDIDLSKVLSAELGESSARLSKIETTPISAGSFAQVYSAKLDGSKNIVLKVLRPEVKSNVQFDLKMIGLVVRIVSAFKSKDLINYSDVYNDLRQITIEETNYAKEVRTAKAMYEKYIEDPVIKIPYTYTDLCSPNIIVQEQMPGVPLTEYLALNNKKRELVLEALNTDLSVAMEKIAYEYISSNIKGEVSHGDPHPGNIYLLSNNRVGLIDFGISGKKIQNPKSLINLLKEYVKLYDNSFDAYGFTENMMGFFVPDIIQALENIGDSMEIDVKEKIMTELGSINEFSIKSGKMSSTARDLLKKQKPLNLFANVLNSKNRFALKANVEATVILRSSNIYLNLITRLGLPKDVVRGAYEQIIEEFDYTETNIASYDAPTLDASYHKVAEWLDRLRYSDPVSYLKLTKALS